MESNKERPTLVGRKNAYTCQCGHKIITVDVDAGTTPFMIVCEGLVGGKPCNGSAQSSMYRVDQTLRATHEWYRPETNRKMHPETRQYVAGGGLLLRKIKQKGE